MGGGGVHVLAVEVVELVAAVLAAVEHDLARPAGLRFVARLGAQYRAFDLARVDALLDQHAPVMVGGLEHGGGQFGRIAFALHFGHTEAGAGTRRLDEQRVAQAGGLDLGHDGRGVGGEPVRGIKGARIQRDARRRGDAGGVQQHLGVMLVHARGRGKHAAADVRHVHHLQQTLNGAVLAVRAVQHRQHRIDVAE